MSFDTQDYTEGGLRRVTISALQHYSYCPRQCALIHVEQTYDQNIYTLRGDMAHERVHDAAQSESRDGVRVERGLALWSEVWGLVGQSDVVELEGERATLRITPVEYKQGGRHAARHDDIQLCAQALCLEEMFGVHIKRGFVYQHQQRKRREVALDAALRALTARTILAVREQLERGAVPPPVADARCPNCSLIDACMPYVINRMRGGI
jgi:CRISPR-associated exonuclease Cas4